MQSCQTVLLHVILYFFSSLPVLYSATIRLSFVLTHKPQGIFNWHSSMLERNCSPWSRMWTRLLLKSAIRIRHLQCPLGQMELGIRRSTSVCEREISDPTDNNYCMGILVWYTYIPSFLFWHMNLMKDPLNNGSPLSLNALFLFGARKRTTFVSISSSLTIMTKRSPEDRKI